MIFFLNKKFKPCSNIFDSLRSTYGLGYIESYYLCKKVGLTKKSSFKEVPRATISRLAVLISKIFCINNDLKRNHSEVWRVRKLNREYTSIRLKQKLPVNGQNTKNNAKTTKYK